MNKLKTKITAGKIGKYLRELSVVVVGIAITFGISNWISSRNEKKDIKLYLTSVKMELEENIKILDSQIKVLEHLDGYSRYLLSHDKKSLDTDTLNSYKMIGSVVKIAFQTHAFEMFKTSGSMRLMQDKELLESLWKVYTDLELIKSELDEYYKLKMDEYLKENQWLIDGKPSNLPLLYHFYTLYADYGILENCKVLLETIKETELKLEK